MIDEATTDQLGFDLISLGDSISIENLPETTPTTYSRNGSNEEKKKRLIHFLFFLFFLFYSEHEFIWFGRILNRTWTDDYYNLSSLASQHLRLDLQNFV